MSSVFGDGKRVAAGLKGKSGASVTQAVASGTGVPYPEVRDAINCYQPADQQSQAAEVTASMVEDFKRRDEICHQHLEDALIRRWVTWCCVRCGRFHVDGMVTDQEQLCFRCLLAIARQPAATRPHRPARPGTSPRKGTPMTEELADNYPDEPMYLTDAPEPCWYCGAAEMGVECGSVVCHEELWR